ncbi:TIGR03905 family TSCPD domain-containing protein [Blautia coccoides]|nr:TIGR03905 family TSCPD domain-containing protein [Blautia coccoides]
MTVYKTRGICSRSIEIELDGDTIASVKFNVGCNSNTKGIAGLVEGMRVDEVIERLKGTDCGGRGTSCPDHQSAFQRSGSGVTHGLCCVPFRGSG